MTNQNEFFLKLNGSRIGLVHTLNREKLVSIGLTTPDGETIYIHGDMVCMTAEEWVNKK